VPFVRERYSYRFADQVLNSKLALKQEIEGVLSDRSVDPSTLSRPAFNQVLRVALVALGWQDQPPVFGASGEPEARMDFLKERVGMEVGFGHASFIGIDLLKSQVSSYSGLDKIDVGVYVVTTRAFQAAIKKKYGQNWEGSLTYEKVVRYLPHFRSAIQVPIYVMGIDL
jgi:Restriction endonuclease BglII